MPISGGGGRCPRDRSTRPCSRRAASATRSWSRPSGGGGGIGMAVAHDADALRKAFDGHRSMSERSFGSDRVFVEKFVAARAPRRGAGPRPTRTARVDRPRRARLLGAAPPPEARRGVARPRCSTRGPCADAHRARSQAAEVVGYRNAGTVEFLLDTETERVRLPGDEHPDPGGAPRHRADLRHRPRRAAAEHRRASGTTTADFDAVARGHAIEVRICAEDPKRFFPSPGSIDVWVEPCGRGHPRRLRLSPPAPRSRRYFDSLVAKVCAYGDTREQALARLVAAPATSSWSRRPGQPTSPFLRRARATRDEFDERPLRHQRRRERQGRRAGPGRNQKGTPRCPRRSMPI